MSLQSCAVRSRTPLEMLCIVVQELHQCLALLLKGDSLLSLEMLDVVEKDPVVATALAGAPRPQKARHQKESHHRWPEWRSLPALLCQTLHLCLNWRGAVHPQDLAPGPSRETPPPPGFPPGPGGPYCTTHQVHIPAQSHKLIWPLCTRVTGDDHLPHPSNGQSPLSLSGSEPYQGIPTQHVFPECHGTLPKDWRTLS